MAVDNPWQAEQVARRLEAEINGVEVTDRVTAYENAPGYSEQQSTLNTQRGFTLLIGVLVVGGFFQIQTLQKVGQVGMLKALGAPNFLVAVSATIQIVLTNTIGVIMGALATFGLAAAMPAGIPIIFNGQEVAVALVTLVNYRSHRRSGIHSLSDTGRASGGVGSRRLAQGNLLWKQSYPHRK